MGFLKGILQVATSPIRGLAEVIDDVSGKNSESEQGLSILTVGLSSVIKGTAKGIKSGSKNIFDL